MSVPEATGLLAGFALAHAAWSISDLPEGEMLCPLAFVEEGAQKQLFRFEADTQEEAISRGRQLVSEKSSSASAWALAREGQMNTSTGCVDVLVIDAWSPDLEEPVTYLQPFQQACPEFCVNGVGLKVGHPFFELDSKASQRCFPIANGHGPFLADVS